MVSPDKRIFVAGASGMVGSAVVRSLTGLGFTNLKTPSSDETDLTETAGCENPRLPAGGPRVMECGAKIGLRAISAGGRAGCRS